MMDLGSFLAITWPWGIGKTCASNMIVYVCINSLLCSLTAWTKTSSLMTYVPRYPLALCEDQILLPLLKMLPALPHHFLFPIETEITI